MAKVSSQQVIDGLKQQGINNLHELAAFIEKRAGDSEKPFAIVFGDAGAAGANMKLEACPLSPR